MFDDRCNACLRSAQTEVQLSLQSVLVVELVDQVNQSVGSDVLHESLQAAVQTIHVISNNIIWCVYLVPSKLRYALMNLIIE